MDRIRILLADDNEEFLALAIRILEPEFEVVKTVGDGEALIEEAIRLKPETLVLDISMPGMTGIEAARHLRAAGCSAKIVILTVHEDPDYLRAAFLAGAQGYVIKCRLASDLLVALRVVMAGRSFVSPSISLEQKL